MPLNLLSNFAVKQTGGGGLSISTSVTIILLSLIVLFIKVFLVHWSYNAVIPKLTQSAFRPITMMEALFLVILIQSLFN